MQRLRKTPLAEDLNKYARKLEKSINNSLVNGINISIVIDDAKNSYGMNTGVVSIEMEVSKQGGWDGGNSIFLYGFVGKDKKQKNEGSRYFYFSGIARWNR